MSQKRNNAGPERVSEANSVVAKQDQIFADFLWRQSRHPQLDDFIDDRKLLSSEMAVSEQPLSSTILAPNRSLICGTQTARLDETT